MERRVWDIQNQWQTFTTTTPRAPQSICGEQKLESILNVSLRILFGLSHGPVVFYQAKCSWGSFRLVLLMVPLIFKIILLFKKVIILCIHSVIPQIILKYLLTVRHSSQQRGKEETLGKYMVAIEEGKMAYLCSWHFTNTYCSRWLTFCDSEG